METAYRQLVLCPADENWVPFERVQFLNRLQGFGVIGQALGVAGDDRYLIGDSFLQLFSFMGCAPSIEFTPTDKKEIDWQSFVFIQLSPALARPRWLADRENAKPACPSCQRRNRDWLAYYNAEQAMLRCPRCEQSDHVCRWHWYDAGACARQFISIVNVYPRESLPTEALLSQLQQETATPWQYFYLHAPLIGN